MRKQDEDSLFKHFLFVSSEEYMVWSSFIIGRGLPFTGDLWFETETPVSRCRCGSGQHVTALFRVSLKASRPYVNRTQKEGPEDFVENLTDSFNDVSFPHERSKGLWTCVILDDLVPRQLVQVTSFVYFLTRNKRLPLFSEVYFVYSKPQNINSEKYQR